MLKKPISKIAQPAKKAAPPTQKAKVPVAKSPKKTPSPKQGQWPQEWVELQKNIMICPGPCSQAHKKFKGRNQQSAAVCIVACAFVGLKKLNTWTKQLLNDILEIGTNLWLKSKQINENRCLDHIKPPNIYKYFFLNNVKIAMRIGTDIMNERVPRDSILIQRVDQMLLQFFKTHTSGIFASNQTYFAIFKFDKFFCIFDPTEHNLQGGKWNGLLGMGHCYCIRTTMSKVIADLIIKNIEIKTINRFMIYPCAVDKYVVIDTTPPQTLKEVQPIPLDAPKVVKKPSVPLQVIKKKTAEKPPEKPAVEPPAAGTQQVEVKKSVSKSMIPPERPKLQSVTNFVELLEGRLGILRASTHQRDPKFTRYMGAQSMANAIAALTMLRHFKSKQWIRNIVNDILILGERIHHDLKKLPSGTLPKRIISKERDFTPKIDRCGVIGKLESDDDKILSLDQAIKNTLIDTDCCILVGPHIVAVWKEDNRYYMFDPEERDAFGRVIEDGQPGVACVTWYQRPTDLVTIYLKNLPRESRQKRFMLSKVTIKDYEAKSDDWYNFKALTFNKWILRGNFSQQDRRFSPESRNAQCTANATMALTFKELKEEKDWSTDTIDQVLINGDEFYRGCVNYLHECGKFKHKYLMVDELKRNFDMENKRVNLEIDDCLVNGVVNAKSDTGIPNLKKGFEQFFLESEAGIITANLQSMAVWKKDDTYYYYDSHSRNEKGIVCSYGTACILRTVTIEDLSNALMSNLGADPYNLYNISRVVVKLIDLAEDGSVKPPLNYYEAVNNLISILRSNTSEKDKKFSINTGKQAVPMCLAALVFNNLTPSNDWTKEDVDQIMKFGDELYTESMGANFAEDVSPDKDVDEVTTSNVKTEMKIGPNEIKMEFELLGSGNYEDNLKEAFQQLEERVEREGKQVFQAIIESPYMTASMWRDDNLIYFFDPRPRDEKGQVYGKDDWSLKGEEPEIPEVVEQEEEPEEVSEIIEEIPVVEENIVKEEKVKAKGVKIAVEGDEMAGGDNLGPPEVPVVEVPVVEPPLEPIEEVVVDEEVKDEVEEPPPPIEKKGSAFWRAKEEEGKACVLRFSRMEDLIQHILENAPPNQHNETEFVLNLVKTENTAVLHELYNPEYEEKPDDIAGDWNQFKEVDYGKWILRGTKNLRDALFLVGNRGKQALPMALIGLVYSDFYSLTKFKPETVDAILAYGDRLYTFVKKRRTKELKDNKDLGLSDEEIEQILKDATYELTDYPGSICISEKLVKWHYQPVIKGDITSKTETVHNVVTGLTAFFEDNKYGILSCKGYPVGVWKLDGTFYMFDPHASGPSGSKSPVGVSCITRFKQLEDLCQLYIGNLPRIGNHFFEISAFLFTKEACIRERHPHEVEEEPVEKIGGFKAVTAGKSILRGDVKLDCTKFDRGVNIHSAAIAYVALAISLNKDPETWTRLIVNEILTVGEELHNDSVDKLGDKFNPWGQRLDICKVNTDFMIGRLKVNCTMRLKGQKGIIGIKNSKTPNLRQGLERFFEENSHGILVADKFILAVWEQMKEKDISIFLFDPNSRGLTGLPGQGGVACVTKFCNAKLASDHIMSCMMDIDKSKTEFTIVPVEIVVGSTKKTVRKVCKPDQTQPSTSTKGHSILLKSTKIEAPKKQVVKVMETTVRTAKPGTCTVQSAATSTCKAMQPSKGTSVKKPGQSLKPGICSPTTIMEQKRVVRQIADEERARLEAQRCHVLGREKMFVINNNEAIVRGLRSIVPDRELPVNLVAFIFMKISPDLSKWTYKQVELVLETGYQLYVDSYNAYKPKGTRLTLNYILRRIVLKDCEVRIEIMKPIPGNTFTKENLFTHITNYLAVTNFCLLAYLEYVVSIYFKGGYYYLFDPYSRDLKGNKTEEGSAVLMRFGNLENLIDKVVKNFEDPQQPTKRYALIMAHIQNVQPLLR